ncbi:MAG TPA: hypothetical protein PLM53_03520 [Spirochaetota bacterium]|nr:hypothetical protein [Spirochaetota bacterium]HPC40281.1 hypothetical protein [Spirochaetota bacterium]HPL15324.1 hypothetical protein [Spirochaetota bacterium]HQF07244.1 hypothetical protein [Spirochaetota bacterium]HQH96145.1 hypothetical protein [Spirochaetota bacterium]
MAVLSAPPEVFSQRLRVLRPSGSMASRPPRNPVDVSSGRAAYRKFLSHHE